MREAGGSTDLIPSIRQHAQDQHERYAYRKGVGTDKKLNEMHSGSFSRCILIFSVVPAGS